MNESPARQGIVVTREDNKRVCKQDDQTDEHEEKILNRLPLDWDDLNNLASTNECVIHSYLDNPANYEDQA